MSFYSLRSLLISTVLIAFVSLQSCAFKTISRSKNITYLSGDGLNRAPQQLNVFAPHHREKLKPVLIYLYGGNWTSGHKSLYNFFGSRWARKGVVTVVVDYPKSPDAKYFEMAMDAATATKWVKENIQRYGGDPSKIFVSGHSAGGQLAALISMDDQYFDSLKIANPLAGTILIDAAGLDMYGYMKDVDYGPQNSYLTIFGDKPEVWKAASPLYLLHPGLKPMLIYQGGRTYPSIATSNRKFVAALKADGYDPEYHILKKKKHIGMITQFFNTGNKRYREMKSFMTEK